MTTPTTTPAPLVRLADWPERLAALLFVRLSSPFIWGANDCCLFAADAVQATTGTDPAAHLRGSYSTATQAARVLAEHGGVRAIATQALGEPMPHAAMAQRGDVVCVPLDGRDTLGVVAGDGQWCAPGELGLVYRPMAEVQTAWRV
jgi:hypothetical protein